MKEKYTDSEKYQREISDQYGKRVEIFPIEEVISALHAIGIQDIDPTEIKQAPVGNVNATYIAPDFVIKMKRKEENPAFIANKIVSDTLSSQVPVVKVLAYDNGEKTPYEILVMERSPGTLLLDDIFELSKKEQQHLFEQILNVVNQLFKIKFDNFGEVNTEDESFATYTEHLKNQFNKNIQKIKAESLADKKDIEKIESYFLRHINIFDQEEAVLVHTDLHQGNVLHDGQQLTAVIDFDSSIKAPKVQALISLLGFIDNPAQFVEGTKYYDMYQGKNFHPLFSTLKQKLPEIFADENLLRKLNLIGLNEGLFWIADNWSEEWNKEQIKRILKSELANTTDDLKDSYYGRILRDK